MARSWGVRAEDEVYAGAGPLSAWIWGRDHAERLTIRGSMLKKVPFFVLKVMILIPKKAL